MRISKDEFEALCSNLEEKVQLTEDDLTCNKVLLEFFIKHEDEIKENKLVLLNVMYSNAIENLRQDISKKQTYLTHLKVDLKMYKDSFDECEKRGFFETDTD